MIGETLSTGVSLGWWILDTAWTTLVVLSSLHNLWPLPIEKNGRICMWSSFIFNWVILTLTGIFEFCSLRKVSGMEVSKLITTGIYYWSRNPQFLGLYFCVIRYITSRTFRVRVPLNSHSYHLLSLLHCNNGRTLP